MTEAGWLASNDPRAMLAWINGKESCDDLRRWYEVSDRKLRLFACACCQLWPGPDDKAIRYDEIAALVDREASEPEYLAVDPLAYGDGGRWANYQPFRLAGQGRDLAALLRDIVGNPFRHYYWYLPKAWLTPTVLDLAHAAYDDRQGDGTLDPVRLLVLADALEEAGCVRRPCLICAIERARGGPGEVRCGCAESDLLAHLRSAGPHVRGCWAVDLLLLKG